MHVACVYVQMVMCSCKGTVYKAVKVCLVLSIMALYITFVLTFSNEVGLTREKHIRNTSCEQRGRG